MHITFLYNDRPSRALTAAAAACSLGLEFRPVGIMLVMLVGLRHSDSANILVKPVSPHTGP